MLRESTGVKYENDSFYGLSCEGYTQIHHGYTACPLPVANYQFRQPNSHYNTRTVKVRTAVDVWLDRSLTSSDHSKFRPDKMTKKIPRVVR